MSRAQQILYEITELLESNPLIGSVRQPGALRRSAGAAISGAAFYGGVRIAPHIIPFLRQIGRSGIIYLQSKGYDIAEIIKRIESGARSVADIIGK
jgi:hypothetical protein